MIGLFDHSWFTLLNSWMSIDTISHPPIVDYWHLVEHCWVILTDFWLEFVCWNHQELLNIICLLIVDDITICLLIVAHYYLKSLIPIWFSHCCFFFGNDGSHFFQMMMPITWVELAMMLSLEMFSLLLLVGPVMVSNGLWQCWSCSWSSHVKSFEHLMFDLVLSQFASGATNVQTWHSDSSLPGLRGLAQRPSSGFPSDLMIGPITIGIKELSTFFGAHSWNRFYTDFFDLSDGPWT